MDLRKCTSPAGVPSLNIAPLKFSIKVPEKNQIEIVERNSRQSFETDVDVDLREVYFLLLHFLSSGPCKRTFAHFSNELLEHQLLPRRYHSWFSRSGVENTDDGDAGDDGISFPSSYTELAERYSHVGKDHLVKLMKQLITTTCSSLNGRVGRPAPNAANVPTILGTGSFSLLDSDKNRESSRAKPPPAYLHWPHMQAGQVRALGLREIGGGFTKHHRAPSIRSACYVIAKPSTLLQKIQNIKKLRGHRNAVYCAIFDRSGRYVITGSDDRLVKVWSMETALCLASCRGHEGDITDLAVSSNNAVVASASNDYVIRVWRLPDGMPVSVLQGHNGAVTAIEFSPRPNSVYHLLSSSDDGTCRIWDARLSHLKPKIYQPKPSEGSAGKSVVSSNNSANGSKSHQILCCAYNADGSVFVTGSSDTFARVWSALKSNTDDPERPIHEMDVLSGHEDDVNYVQFSGCHMASKPTLFDSLKEESIPKFKNSWFCHDNIVTCSRDGSAIIWVPRSRRSHGKVGRWTLGYHLKVPPPPLPPQPARGGPRQRFLPTPRGVNMIVWSLDNHFVLAAIMDCRICVWNAVDGSLVHSLTGHTASSYVLDVHPFNPRIAMSAGYDGQTIVWDIWEGTPVRIYQMGDFKLVDGKFSADGTSIVLSDDAGQIYLINTGEGELQKDAKYDQFFLGDYRPVVRDSSGGVLDQETQLPPHQRNIQDRLCDSSLMPYPEPYQTAYQQRRLGALGIEWRPSTMNIAVGQEISLGLDYLMPPLPDLERIIEPMPEFIDAVFWEPENEVLSEDSDSEYNVAEENSSEGEKEKSISSSMSDSEFSAEDGNNKDGLRRSRRKKHKIDSMPSSGRRAKKRSLDESAGTSSASCKNKKPKPGRRVSKRKSSKAKALRPKRLAAYNARNMLLQISGTSSEEEGEFGSEHDSSDSEVVILDDLSDSELVMPKTKSNEPDCDFQDMNQKCSTDQGPPSSELEETAEPSQIPESQSKLVKKGRLVLKFSLRDRKKEVPTEDPQPKCDRETDSVPSSSIPQKPTKEKRILKFSIGPQSISAEETDVMPSKEDVNIENADIGQPESSRIHLEGSTSDAEHEASWGEVKIRTSRHSRSEDLDFKKFDASEFEDLDDNVKEELDSIDYELKSSPKESLDQSKHSCESPSALDHSYEVNHSKKSDEKENPPRILTKIRIKTKSTMLVDPKNPSKIKFFSAAKERNPVDDMAPENPPHLEDDVITEMEETSRDFPETSTDAVRRTRSYNIKATSREANTANHSFRVIGNNHQSAGTSRGVQESSKKDFNQLDRRSRAGRNNRGQNSNYERGSSSSQSMLTLPVGKLSWLTLSHYEDGYRYIPQLGDEVVYLRQGHEEFAKISRSRDCPPRSLKANMNSVEVCKVETLEYTWVAGSGESCCKIKLKFIDPCSNVCGKSFTLTLPELKDFSDFVIEKALYDTSIKRNWTARDTCHVWWRNQDGEGGKWYEGRLISTQAKSPEFPDSPWLRYQVLYDEYSTQVEQHNPWELCDSPYQAMWDRPHIDSETQEKLLHYFTKLEDKYHIIQQMNHAVLKSDYCNRIAAPFYPELIKTRLKNDYYRSLEAVKNDLRVMFSNAESYFVRRESTAMIANISQWFMKKLSRLS